MITSVQHAAVKQVVNLYQRKYRDRTGLFVVEGSKLIEEALNAGVVLEQVFHTDTWVEAADQVLVERLRQANIPLLPVAEHVLKRLADTENPQGVVAVAQQNCLEIAHMPSGDNSLYLVLDRVQDPGNVGTILRTAEAAGASAVLLLEGSVDVYSPKVLRSAMGAVFRLPVVQNMVLADLKRLFGKLHIKTIAADLEASHYYFDYVYEGPIAILLGNEGQGLSRELKVYADQRVKIPIMGKVESLNVSAAAAVLLYEVVRQRCKLGASSPCHLQ